MLLTLSKIGVHLFIVLKAFKYVFTSPSSVDKEPKATRSGNARLHGMRCVTPGSIAYIATQVCSNPTLFNHNLSNLIHRCALPWLHLQFFLARTPSRTPKDFTPAFSNCLKTLTKNRKFMISMFGGTGTYYSKFTVQVGSWECIDRCSLPTPPRSGPLRKTARWLKSGRSAPCCELEMRLVPHQILKQASFMLLPFSCSCT